MTISFFKRYPLLHELLGSYFCTLDYEDKSYEDAVNDYKKGLSDKLINDLKQEFIQVSEKKDADHKFIRDHSNVYLESDEEMYEWFNELYSYLIKK